MTPLPNHPAEPGLLRCLRPASPAAREGRGRRAFTLVELLVVVGMMVVLMAMVLPAITSLRGATNLTTASYDVSGMIQLARSYAIANNTYVYLGISEVSAGTLPGTTEVTSGTGRLVLFAVATDDGTKGFKTPLTQNVVLTSGSFRPIAGLMRLNSVHAPNGLGPVPATGNMGTSEGRRDVTTLIGEDKLAYELLYPSDGSSSATPAIGFTYPLSATTPQYNFGNVNGTVVGAVIQFDPQGAARVLMNQNNTVDTDSVPYCIEICMQQSNGTAALPAPANPNTGNQISIQVDGMTGNVRVFRP